MHPVLAILLIAACTTQAPSVGAESAGAPLVIAEFDNSVRTAQGALFECVGGRPDVITDALTTLGDPAEMAWRIDLSAGAPERGAGGIVPLPLTSGDDQAGSVDLARYSHLGLRLMGVLGERMLHIELALSAGQLSTPMAVTKSLPASGLNEQQWVDVVLPLADLDRTRALTGGTIRLMAEGSGAAWFAVGGVYLLADEKMPTGATRGSPRDLRTAMWVWNTRELWPDAGQVDEMFAFCARQRITDLFCQIAYTYTDGVCHLELADAQRRFNAEAARRGITVHALDGRRDYVLKEKHPQMLALMDALIEFNSTGAESERYRAVHLDNEPYLLPGWSDPAGRAQIVSDYLELNRLLHARAHAAGLAYGVDIPFWFDTLDARSADKLAPEAMAHNPDTLAHAVLRLVDNAGIMSYRERATGANGVVGVCLTEFAFAAERGVDIFASIELGTGPDVEKGITLGVFSPEYLVSQLSTLRAALANQPGCAGIAVHYYEPFRSLEKRS